MAGAFYRLAATPTSGREEVSRWTNYEPGGHLPTAGRCRPHKGYIVRFMADRNASRAQRLQRQMNSQAEGAELFASEDPCHTFLRTRAYAAGKHA